VHWGLEWHRGPTEDLQRAGHDLIDSGVDLVVGTHSHVLNPPELYRGHLIAYSLGDLIADFLPLETRTGAVLDVTFVKTMGGETRLTAFSLHPTLVERPNHLREVESGERRRAWDLARTRLGDGVTALDVGN
jgi:poly-gamma-glutamate capsule biosynthesis protein CapA/YwtB (metallophosphatase superfamily)